MKSSHRQYELGSAFAIYSRLLKYARRYWLALGVSLIASMLYSGIDAWFIYFLKPLTNKALVAKEHHFIHYAPFMLLGVFLLRSIMSFFSNYFMAKASRSVIMNLRQDIFYHLQKLPARYYDHMTTGKILSVLLYSVEQVANASADVLITAIQAFFLIISLIYVMFTTSWKLTLLYFIIIPFVTSIMRFFSLRVRRLSLCIQGSVAEMSDRAEETIEGYKIVRAFDGQQYEVDKFNEAAQYNRRQEMKVVSARSISSSAVQFIVAVALSFTIYIGTADVKDQVLNAGQFLSMLGAMYALLKPLKDLTSLQNKLDRGLAGAQNVFAVLDAEPEVDTGTRTLTRAKGKITFSQVNFSYVGDKEVLNNISFTIEPGEVVALVGRSGSGKSTIVSLLPRFYADYTGEIYLDDVPIRDYRLQDLRHQFAMVSQNVTLFHDTVANNIAYGRFESVTAAEVVAAAKASHADEFIEALPKQYETLIGENGVLLSGGQRQRLAIARAILKNSPILILDEATSALDTESERYIQSALEELMKSRTTLVIAHRLSTVEHANKIIVMDQGSIVEIGTHKELLALEGHYSKLYRMQFKDAPSLVEIQAAEVVSNG